MSVKEQKNQYDVIFSLSHLKTIINDENDKDMKNISTYINKFFFKYNSDIFFDNGETYELLSLEEAKKKIPFEYKKAYVITVNGKPEIKEYKIRQYFESEMFLNSRESKITIDYDKEYKYIEKIEMRGYKIEYNFLNMKKELPRNYDIKIPIEKKAFVKKGVNLFFDHIKNIICSGYEDEYNVTIKFLASSVIGHKCKIALYWKSNLEQSGKGTVLNTIEKIIGKRMVKTSNVEIIDKYTKQLEGATLINMDEMEETTSKNKALSDKLKSLITEPNFDCREMYSMPYSQRNTFNIIMTSNNNAIKLTQSNNIRYYVNTINEKYTNCNSKEEIENKKKYFDELYKYIDEEIVLIGIYKKFKKIYKKEVEPTNWTGAYESNKTKRGCENIIESMPLFYRYIKENYVLKKLAIDVKCSDLLNNYNADKKYLITAHKLGENMRFLGCELKDVRKDKERYKKYVMSYDNLLEKFKSLNYISEYDEFYENNNENDEDDDEKEDEFKTKYEELLKTNNDLQKQILELKKQNEEMKNKKDEPLKTIKKEPLKTVIDKVKVKKPKKEKKNEDLTEDDIDDCINAIDFFDM